MCAYSWIINFAVWGFGVSSDLGLMCAFEFGMVVLVVFDVLDGFLF